MNVPLGLAESQTLEFQSARILDKPDWTRTVAREVVAFLNTELGGTLWIGLREESSTAVKVEDVADAESRRAALWDALLDRVEPRLAEGEVEIAVVRHDPTGACLLMIEIHGCCARGPWAALEGSGRQFLVRAGPHVRPLGRDELAQAFRDRHQAAEQEERRERETWETLVARRNDLQARGWCGLWVAVAPTSGVQVAGLGGVLTAARAAITKLGRIPDLDIEAPVIQRRLLARFGVDDVDPTRVGEAHGAHPDIEAAEGT